MRHSFCLLFLFGLCSNASETGAMELHSFDFNGNDAFLIATLGGLNAGSYTSVGHTDEVNVDISTNLGVLDFTNGLGNLGVNNSSLGSATPQKITLDFSNSADTPLRIHSLKVSSLMEMGTPFVQTFEFVLDPNIDSQSLYRFENGQSILLGSYNHLESGDAQVMLDNLQYGYHSLQSVTIACDSSHTSVPEPATAVLLLTGLSVLGFFRIRSR